MTTAEKIDVLVIGGGVMGASVAFWLTRMQPGMSVLVVEQDPSYAFAATALSVASIRQQFTTAVNVEISRFGIGFIRDIAGHLGPQGGIASLGLKENGYLFVTGNADAAVLMQEVAEMQRGLGATTEVLTPSGIKAKFPWMEVGDLVAGSFGPQGEGWFDNMGLLSGFRAAAKAQGARFIRDRVTGVDVAGDRVAGVVLEKGGRVACAAAVNAAGTRAADVMRMVGLDLPVEPRKRTV
ncbi:MAG: FAD-binding oxidoreductase, partial [Rhodoferax sp.]|nr:FAD-binding oxidoreductase [Pseudorhodobacter sp.]